MVDWTDPPLYVDPALIVADDWNDTLRNDFRFLQSAVSFRFYWLSTAVAQSPKNELIKSAGGHLTDGTFKLSYTHVVTQGGVTTTTVYVTPDINWNATSAEIFAALKTIPVLGHYGGRLANIFTAHYTVTPVDPSNDDLDHGINVAFNPLYFPYGPIATLVVIGNGSTLIGDTLTVTVTSVGLSLYYMPFNGFSFRSGGASPDPIPFTGLWHFHVQYLAGAFVPYQMFLFDQDLNQIGAGPSLTTVSTLGHIRASKYLNEGESVRVYCNRQDPGQGNASTFFEGYWSGG